jgi:uncharacterized hydrophobic protein (TIGR00271 family)
MIEGSAISTALLEGLEARLAAARMLFRTREEIYQDAYEGRQFNFVYFAMLVFACLIALFGLLLNSPAVIIGAMLISPLMGPILSCGLAFTLADWDLGSKAAKNALLSVGETIFIAALATSLSPLKDATPEILARTTPNLMDLLIAFFSGLAGTLALSSRRGGLTILPGVAIATAVMPPLATVGYGVSTRQWNVAAGAFMLFFTNFTAIVISAHLVFLLIGFRPRQVRTQSSHAVLVKWRILIASIVLLALSVPLLRTLLKAAQQARLRKEIYAVLHEQFDRPGKRRLASLDIKAGQDPILVDASVQTQSFIEPPQINAVEAAVSARLRKPVRLMVEQVQLAHEIPPTQMPTSKGTNDFVAGGVVRSGEAPELAASASDMLSRLQDRVVSVLEPLLRPASVHSLHVDGLVVEEGGILRIELSGRQAGLSETQAWKVASVVLGKDLRAPVHVIAALDLDSPSHDVRFRKSSSYLPSSELRKAVRFRAGWKERADVQCTFIASAQARPELLAGRIVALRRAMHGEEGAVVRSDAHMDENMIRMQFVQRLDVSGGSGDARPASQVADLPRNSSN